MPKALCIAGIVVAVILILVFGLDLALAMPFGRASLVMDVALVACGIILAYLGWSTLREQT